MKKIWQFLYLPQIIFGGIDGLVTTFAVVAGATGGWLTAKTVIIMGIANVLADGVSMSIGAYLSTREEHKKNISASLVWFHTFVAFIFFGLLPLLPYILQAHKNIFLLSCIITGSSFVAIGYLKGVMNNRSILRAIIQVVILGGIAASVAYYAGVFLGAL